MMHWPACARHCRAVVDTNRFTGKHPVQSLAQPQLVILLCIQIPA